MPLLPVCYSIFFFNDPATTEIYTLSLHDALPISKARRTSAGVPALRSRAIASMAFFAEPYSMYAGTSFMARSATTMNMNSHSTRPVTVTPLCLLFISCLPAACSAEGSEAPQLVQVEPDEERLADDVAVGHEPPHAAVARIVPVVAHHEVMPRRNRARQAAHIVVAIAGVRERARRGDEGRRVVLEQDLVLLAVQGLGVAAGKLHALLRQVVVDLPQRHRLPVDGQALVAIFHTVAGQPDHALDVVERRILRKAENHHVAALRAAERDQLHVGHRQADAVREFVHEDEV